MRVGRGTDPWWDLEGRDARRLRVRQQVVATIALLLSLLACLGAGFGWVRTVWAADAAAPPVVRAASDVAPHPAATPPVTAIDEVPVHPLFLAGSFVALAAALRLSALPVRGDRLPGYRGR